MTRILAESVLSQLCRLCSLNFLSFSPNNFLSFFFFSTFSLEENLHSLHSLDFLRFSPFSVVYRFPSWASSKFCRVAARSHRVVYKARPPLSAAHPRTLQCLSGLHESDASHASRGSHLGPSRPAS